MPTRRTDTFRTLASLSRVELLHLLQVRGKRSLAELVEETGLHANTIREHIARLEARGYVTQEHEVRVGRGRPRTLYSAASGKPGESNAAFRRMVSESAERGDFLRRYLARTGDAPASELGEDALHQLDALDEHFDQCGIDALVDQETLAVDLANCPFDDVVALSDGLACTVHLGIVRSVLNQAGGPLEARELLPVHGPKACVMHLGVAEPRPESTPK